MFRNPPNRGQLIVFALGEDEARKVDTAIPQPVFDQMTEAARRDIAGWYYAPEAKMFGRLLTMSEVLGQIQHKLKNLRLRASPEGMVWGEVWTMPCLHSHILSGEIQLERPPEGRSEWDLTEVMLREVQRQ